MQSQGREGIHNKSFIRTFFAFLLVACWNKPSGTKKGHKHYLLASLRTRRAVPPFLLRVSFRAYSLPQKGTKILPLTVKRYFIYPYTPIPLKDTTPYLLPKSLWVPDTNPIPLYSYTPYPFGVERTPKGYYPEGVRVVSGTPYPFGVRIR